VNVRRSLSQHPRPLARCALAFAVAISAWACHPIPPPQILAQADAIASGPASREAERLAASAFARAERLRTDAHTAFEDGRRVDAQFLGEQAVAAYAYARALARLARADAERERAAAALDESKSELTELQKEQSRLDAELAALEARIQVIRDAELPSSSGPASPERERARRAAATTLVGQARLLCAAAGLLLAMPGTATGELTRDLDAAQKALAQVSDDLESSQAAPLDAARASRARCLGVLTRVRRAQTPVSAAPGQGDALLSELSATKRFHPSRDDRGVGVTLRGAFAGEGLSPSGETSIADLVGVARAHPSFPVIVVLHLEKDTKSSDARALAQKQVDAVAERFRAAGATQVEALVAGAALPVVDPGGKDRSRNARLEIVFVTPETF
jgi:hypothetical protein